MVVVLVGAWVRHRLSIGHAKVFFRVVAAVNVSRIRHACRKSAALVFDCEQVAKN
jgi:hypothetical protein